MSATWHILDRNGHPIFANALPPRPPEAIPLDNGSPFTPWYDHVPRLFLAVHPESGQLYIQGLQGKAQLINLQQWIGWFVAYEALLLDWLGPGCEDDEITFEEAKEIIELQRRIKAQKRS